LDQGTQSDTGRLESSFDVMALPDLLQWLGGARKTGEWRVRLDAACRRIYFEDGRIVAALSNEPHLLLGQYLIAHGRIDANELQRCMKLQESGGSSVGDLLVEGGQISRPELERAVLAKTEESVFGLFDWQHARFSFEMGRRPSAETIRIDLAVEPVLLEGVRRLDELNRIRLAVPSMDVVLHRTERKPDAPTVASHVGRSLYESVNGNRTLREIVLSCRVSEYEACSYVLRLAERGLVRLGDLRDAPGAVERSVDAAEQVWELVAAGDFADALELIDRCSLRSEPDRSMELLIAKAETGFLAEAYRREVPPDAIPTRARFPRSDRESLSGEELFLLDLLDGKWDVRSLTWIAPLRKLDTILALIRLRRGGYIELRLPAAVATATGAGSGSDAACDARPRIETEVKALDVEVYQAAEALLPNRS